MGICKKSFRISVNDDEGGMWISGEEWREVHTSMDMKPWINVFDKEREYG